MNLIEEINNSFSFLLKRGFKIKNGAQQSDQHMVILINGDIKFRIIHDRSDWFFDIGYSFIAEKWYELWDILSLLRQVGLLNQDYKPTNKLNGIRSAVKTSIEGILQVDKYKQNLVSLNL